MMAAMMVTMMVAMMVDDERDYGCYYSFCCWDNDVGLGEGGEIEREGGCYVQGSTQNEFLLPRAPFLFTKERVNSS